MQQADLATIEGTWDEIASRADQFKGHRLRVTILPHETERTSDTMISRGMFPQLARVTEDDFKIAEFRGDPDDGLDWAA